NVFLVAYTLFNSVKHAASFFNASTAACCKLRNIPESMLLRTRSTASMYSFLPATQPKRQPAMLCDLLKEFNSSATSVAPSIDKILMGCSFKMRLYGLSFIIKKLCLRARFTNACNSSREAMRPVGMCGKLTHMIFTRDKSCCSSSSKSMPQFNVSFSAYVLGLAPTSFVTEAYVG